MPDLTRRHRVWDPEDFSQLCAAIARHPATQAKNALQEAVEADWATAHAEPCPVINLNEYRGRK